MIRFQASGLSNHGENNCEVSLQSSSLVLSVIHPAGRGSGDCFRLEGWDLPTPFLPQQISKVNVGAECVY